MPQADDIEIQFNPLYAWLLVGFGCGFFFLSLLIMTPWAVGGSVAVGLLICLASVCGFAGGLFWLKRLPVILRFTREELQMPGSAPVRWDDVETVDVRTIRIDDSDILQEAYLEAAKKLPEYLAKKPLPFFLWLRRITGQKLIDAHRRHLGAKMRDAGQEVSLRSPCGT